MGIRRNGPDSYVLEVDDYQFHLLRSAAVVYSYWEKATAVRRLTLGSEEASLAGPLQMGRAAGDVVPGSFAVSSGQLHALHSLLLTLPTVSFSEEEFVERVGYFREALLKLASLLRSGLRVLGEDEEVRGLRGRYRSPGHPSRSCPVGTLLMEWTGFFR